MTRRQDGLAVLVKEGISFRRYGNLEGSHEEKLFEVMVTEISFGKKGIIFCIVYRPPSSPVKSFLFKLLCINQIWKIKMLSFLEISID